jgi:xylulokinase
MADGLLAVDLGTSGVKAGVVGLDGELVSLADRGYGLIEGGGPGWVEQDARTWWDSAREAMKEAVAKARGTTIVGACIGGQGPSPVPIDQHGEPLANAIIWMDRRSEPERRAMSDRLGSEASPYSCVPKLLWLKRHRPEVYEKARWFLQSWDFIAFRLTGNAVASSFADNHVFPRELVDAAELDPAKFPPEIVMGTAVGVVRPDIAKELGIGAGVTVAGGVNDSTATVLGGGLVRRGLALDLGGTSGGIALAWDEPLREGGLTAWPAPTPGLFVCGGPFAAAGRALAWALPVLGYGTADFAAIEADAARIAPGADGLVFLPYLAGERTPMWDDRARGMFFGLTERHTRAHLARAVFEGVAFGLRHVADLMRERGGRIDELRTTGGQARIALWGRIKADVLGVPVVVPAVLEGAVMGEAMLAAAGAGRAADPASAAATFIKAAARYEPDPGNAAAYERAYRTYRELYPRLRDLMRDGSGPEA